MLTDEQYGIASKCAKFTAGRQAHSSAAEGVEADAEDLILCGTAFRTLPRIKATLTNTIQQCDTISLSFPSHEDIVRRDTSRFVHIAWNLLRACVRVCVCACVRVCVCVRRIHRRCTSRCKAIRSAVGGKWWRGACWSTTAPQTPHYRPSSSRQRAGHWPRSSATCRPSSPRSTRCATSPCPTLRSHPPPTLHTGKRTRPKDGQIAHLLRVGRPGAILPRRCTHTHSDGLQAKRRWQRCTE